MIKFILIAGVLINPQYITSLVPTVTVNDPECRVYVFGATSINHPGVWDYEDERSCAEIAKLLGVGNDR